MASLYKLNKMASTVKKIEQYLPKSWHSFGYTTLFNHMVKLAGTAGLRVETMNAKDCTVTLKNRTRIQNHIGSLHACSMALAAESASGIVVGLNVPDTHIPLIKSMSIQYKRRCQGDIRVKAWINDDDYQRIHTEEKGDVLVNVEVYDETNNIPIETEMIWAWVSKNKKKSESQTKEVS